MPELPSFDDYVSSLSQLTPHVDPTSPTDEAAELAAAAEGLAALPEVSRLELTFWVHDHPEWVPALGLAVGLSQEKLKNSLKDHFDTSGWQTLARRRPGDLVRMLDERYDLLRLISQQRHRTYTFGDVLVARAGSRVTATRAGVSGRRVEDEIELIVRGLRLPYAARTKFAGRGGRSAPCDLAIPDGPNAEIAVAAKGFDSTGSKLTDAVREIEEMADVRQPRQYVYAVIDGIGWKSRKSDLRRIYDLWDSRQVDGIYTLASLDQFRREVAAAARRLGIVEAADAGPHHAGSGDR